MNLRAGMHLRVVENDAVRDLVRRQGRAAAHDSAARGVGMVTPVELLAITGPTGELEILEPGRSRLSLDSDEVRSNPAKFRPCDRNDVFTYKRFRDLLERSLAQSERDLCGPQTSTAGRARKGWRL